jgi:hypothetical protein
MTLPEELAFTRLSYGNKYHKAVPGYMKRIRDLYEAVYARFGEDGLDLIRDVSTEYGTRIANNARKKGDLPGAYGDGESPDPDAGRYPGIPHRLLHTPG